MIKKDWFLRIEFICIIWTGDMERCKHDKFLRIEFICIIWTTNPQVVEVRSSWGLNLFVLFEPVKVSEEANMVLEDWIYLYYLNEQNSHSPSRVFLRIEYICIIWTQDLLNNTSLGSWGLNLFVLFEQVHLFCLIRWVLEDWIYLYYLNLYTKRRGRTRFLRIEFICIIWTDVEKR